MSTVDFASALAKDIESQMVFYEGESIEKEGSYLSSVSPLNVMAACKYLAKRNIKDFNLTPNDRLDKILNRFLRKSMAAEELASDIEDQNSEDDILRKYLENPIVQILNMGYTQESAVVHSFLDLLKEKQMEQVQEGKSVITKIW
jgi:hypothetical protein